MADVTKITKVEKSFLADDGQKRGPMTMSRLRFHPREPKLLAQIVDRRLALFDLDAEPVEISKKGKQVPGELVCPHEIGWVRGFAVHPSGEAVITGGSDRTLRLWPWADGRPAAASAVQVAAHDGWVEAVAYSRDGKLVVSVGADKKVKIWNAADLKLLETLAGHARYLADVVFTYDGQCFLTGGEDGKVIVWETASLKSLATIETGGTNNQFGQTPRHSGVHRLAISHDDRWLGVASGEALNLYDLVARAIVATEKCDMDLAFHPSANLLVAGESEVRFFNYDPAELKPPELDKNGKPAKPKAIPGKQIASVKRGDWSLGIAFSPDGKRVALGKSDGTVELHDVA
jgi:WD40 repeat protein